MNFTPAHRTVLLSILSGSYTPYDGREFVRLCYTLALPLIRKRIVQGKIDLEVLGLKQIDLVYAKKPAAIELALKEFTPKTSILSVDGGFFVKATMRGISVRELNHTFLSAVRRVEPKATVHAEWRSGATTEWFFGNIRKGSVKNCKSATMRNHHRGSPRLISEVPSAML